MIFQAKTRATLLEPKFISIESPPLALVHVGEHGHGPVPLDQQVGVQGAVHLLLVPVIAHDLTQGVQGAGGQDVRVLGISPQVLVQPRGPVVVDLSGGLVVDGDDVAGAVRLGTLPLLGCGRVAGKCQTFHLCQGPGIAI